MVKRVVRLPVDGGERGNARAERMTHHLQCVLHVGIQRLFDRGVNEVIGGDPFSDDAHALVHAAFCPCHVVAVYVHNHVVQILRAAHQHHDALAVHITQDEQWRAVELDAALGGEGVALEAAVQEIIDAQIRVLEQELDVSFEEMSFVFT